MFLRPSVCIALIAALAFLTGCSTPPSSAQKGTPAFYWQAARETFAAGDYQKSLDHLDRLLAGENEYTAKAVPMYLVLTSGMAAGYIDTAEHYVYGGRVNKVQTAEFRREISANRAMASRLVLQFAEKFARLDTLKGDTVPLAFGFPKGNIAPVALLRNAALGGLLPPGQVETARQSAIERGVLLAACRAVGASNDPARAEQVLKDPEAQVPRSTFLVGMADSLYNESLLYAPEKLDDPQKLEILCERAEAALKAVPETSETRALSGRIQTLLKRRPA